MTDVRDIYQAEMQANIEGGWNRGVRNMLAVLPTGGGKTRIVSKVALRKHMTGASQFIGAHRNELVGQMSLAIASVGIKHRIIASKSTVAEVTALHRQELGGRSFVDPTSNCAVGSVQTLASRASALKSWCDQVDDWTIDEAHHVLKDNIWGSLVKLFPNAKGLGVTASPSRADGLGLGSHADGVFDEMVIGPNMRDLINMGALSEYDIACPESDLVVDDDDFAASGELSPTKGRKASQASHIVGDAVKEYVKLAYGKRFICFATDVETATEIAENFNSLSIPVAAVSAKTPAGTRNEYIRRFRAGHLWGLINVDLFGEGFDVPAVEVVIMARPTGSLAVYLQQFGRALRVLAGKSLGLVIDHVSNWKRHGLPDKPHYWSLDRRDRKQAKDPEEIALTACRGCSRPYLRCLPACPRCGWAPPLPEPRERSIAMVDGDLTLLGFEALEAMRKAVLLDSPAAVANRSPGIAANRNANFQIERHQSQQALAEAIAIWAGWQRAKGRTDSESYRRFYLTLGVDVSSALTLDRKEMDAITARVTEWCK